MKNKGYIYVFDYTNCQIYELDCNKYDYPSYFEDMTEFVEDVFLQEKINYDNCCWMHSFEKLEIIEQ